MLSLLVFLVLAQLQLFDSEADAPGFGVALVALQPANNAPCELVACSSPFESPSTVTILDIETRHAIAKIKSDNAGEWFGLSLASHSQSSTVGDRLIIGSPSTSGIGGRVLVSDQEGHTLRIIAAPASIGAFGTWVTEGPDINKDGTSEILIGAPSGRRQQLAGEVIVYDGVTFEQIARWKGTGSESRFGAYIQACTDVDRDGIGDVVVSAPCSCAAYSLSCASSISILSAASGKRLATCVLTGTDLHLLPAAAVVTRVDSGEPEAIVAIAKSRAPGSTEIKASLVWFDMQGHPIGRRWDRDLGCGWRIDMADLALDVPQSRMLPIGDVDSDGIADILLTVTSMHRGLLGHCGGVSLLSPGRATILQELSPTGSEILFGASMCAHKNSEHNDTTILIGAPDLGLHPGAVYIFDAASFRPLQKLTEAICVER